MKRGEIWWAELGLPEKSEPGYKRPVLIIQADGFNDSKINTVVCIALTSNARLSDAPGNLLLSRKESKLSKESVVNVSQIVTLDKTILVEKVSTLPTEIMDRIEKGVLLVLGIEVVRHFI